ncbi:MAG: hypothetical protein ABR512_07900 [Desulfopila sp.]
MSPKPYTPDDEIEYINKAGIRKKKGKSGNSQKRADYFLQQRFPFLEALAVEGSEDKKTRSIRKKPTVEEQQAAAAPLARIRSNMMQEYKRRLLAQQQELEKAATKKV